MTQAQHDFSQPAATLARYRRIEEIVPAHWTEGTVVANGIRQHYYRTGGDKPQIVLLHGILAGGLAWLRVAQALEHDYDLIMVDARGHGRSESAAAGFSPKLLAEDVAAFIQTLELDQPILLGHSMGGVTATLVAAAHPDLVRALMIEDAAWGDSLGIAPQMAESEPYRAWFDAYLAYLERLKTQSHAERLVAALPYLPPGQGVWPEAELVPWVEVQAQLDLDLVRRGPALWAVMNPPTPLRELVRQIVCPILLLTGEHGNCQPQVVQEVVAAWRDGQHVQIAGAGHLLHLDRFDRFIAEVAQFLEAQRVR